MKRIIPNKNFDKKINHIITEKDKHLENYLIMNGPRMIGGL